MYHLNQSTHHLLASREVGNHTIAQWTDSTYILMSLLIHHLRLVTYSNHLVGTAIQSHNRRLIYHNLIIADNDGVGSAKVHGNFLYETKKSHILMFNVQYSMFNVYLAVFSNQALIAVS